MEQMTSTVLFKIFQDCKKSRFDKDPDFNLVHSEVCLKLDIDISDKLVADVKSAYEDFKKNSKKQRSITSSSRVVEDFVCLQRKNYLRKLKRPLEDVSDRQQRRRLSEFIKSTKSLAAAENTSPSKLHAFGLKSKYLKSKEVSKVGKIIFNDETSSQNYISLNIASAIFECGNLTKRSYTDIRLLLKTAGADVLPPYKELDDYRKDRRPPVEELQEPFSGVKFDYVRSLELTSNQLLNSLQLPAFNNIEKVFLSIHDGLDGSGGHSIFNQVDSTETNNIIMYMFRVENLKSIDGKILWENPLHASSSSCRPVMLLMGKETRENCEIVSRIQQERQSAQFFVKYHDRSISVEIDAKMSMVDGKLHSLVTGLGGAFCCLCTSSKEQCSSVEYITSGFEINRSLEQTLQICERDLHLERNRATGDYEVRIGVTQEPITTEDINNLHPLHNLLRCFGWLYKICYHATAGHLSWSEGKLNVSNRVAQALAFMKNAKEEIQDLVKRETSIIIEKPDPTGHGGSSTTGNIAKKILNTSSRKLLTQGISNSNLRDQIDKIILNMAVILSIINSNRKVNIDKYYEFCRNTYLKITDIKWIEFTSTVHIVLGHSPELIRENNNTGLLNYTECGIEANNKFLRQYRINKSRKTSQFDNLSDCINRLWDKSDPLVVKCRERLSCTHCKGVGHTIRSCPDMKSLILGCNSEYESLLCFLTQI